MAQLKEFEEWFGNNEKKLKPPWSTDSLRAAFLAGKQKAQYAGEDAHDEFVNEILLNAPESLESTEGSAESCAIRYVRELEALRDSIALELPQAIVRLVQSGNFELATPAQAYKNRIKIHADEHRAMPAVLDPRAHGEEPRNQTLERNLHEYPGGGWGSKGASFSNFVGTHLGSPRKIICLSEEVIAFNPSFRSLV